MVAAINVRVLVAALERVGYDTAALLAAADLQLVDLDHPDCQVPARVYLTLLDVAQRQRSTPNLALKLAAATPIGAYPVIDYLVVTCNTVGEGFAQQARYFRLAGAPVSLTFQVADDRARVVVDSPVHPVGAEYLIALTIGHAMRETQGRFKAQYVSFQHEADDVEEFQQALGCPIFVKASWSGFAVSLAMLQLPMPRRHPGLHASLERRASEMAARLPALNDLKQNLRRILAWRLPRGDDIRISAVARQAGMSSRTLQRTLATAGLTYHGVLEELRRDKAYEYLSMSGHSLAEIAFLLGYADPAIFIRAFKRWTGVTPQTYRAHKHSKSET